MNYKLSLIVPCYNEERTIETLINKVLDISNGQEFSLEIIVVDDASTDGSWQILEKIAAQHNEIKIIKHEKNRGKGAALRTGFIHATGDFVGIQDADAEYNPRDYIIMLEPLIDGRADVVYGSRYLRPDTRRVLYFWHTWMNKTLTALSNMFTNLDITDMETCYKLFRREIIQKIAPDLKEERFGFEPEITAKVAEAQCRVYECAISYNPRTYEEGKKIGWKDGIHALYCIFHYSAHVAPLPMQILIYLFIGGVSLLVNMFFFIGLTRAGITLNHSIIISFIISALCNYFLCIAILFRHKARWNTGEELFWYIFSVMIMGGIDFALTRILIKITPFFAIHWSGAKFLASILGFIGNFVLRKVLIFPEKKKNIALKTEKFEKILRNLSILAIVCCFTLLFPQVRNFIILAGEKILGRNLNHDKWMEMQLHYSLNLIFCLALFIVFFLRGKLIPILESINKFINKYGKKIFVFASIGIVLMSIIVRIVMYIKSRSLWLDEALLAESFVSRNFFELLVPPLLNAQSVPIFYLIVVKSFCLIFGYSEFSLRIFSLFSFICLLICEIILLKKAFNLDNFKIAFVVTMTALLPSYIFYSNEFKPYMGDVFFIVLIILLYYFYKQDKIKLPILTSLCILILGFSTPTIFFTGGILFSEFLIAIINKNKKKLLYIIISGTTVLIVFGLYYYWWFLPVSEVMTNYWGKPHIKQLLDIFSPKFIKFFVPFALLGMFFLGIYRNKIVFSIVLSLFFAFFASSIGKWPLIGRLWLFLPAIVLFFTPVGIDFIYNKIKYKKIINTIEFFFYSTMLIYFSINCLACIGDKMYYPAQEVNPLIYYVQKNIKEDEKLYVYDMAKFAFKFKNGYNSTRVGNVVKHNIIYGKNRLEWNESSVGNELLSILENQKTYLLFQHYSTGIYNGLSVLQNYGTLTEIMNVHDTPLYYFELDENKDREY